MTRILGEIGQWAAFVACSAGIVIEIRYEAHVGFVCLTVGSLLWGLFTKIKYYGGHANKRRAEDQGK